MRPSIWSDISRYDDDPEFCCICGHELQAGLRCDVCDSKPDETQEPAQLEEALA